MDGPFFYHHLVRSEDGIRYEWLFVKLAPFQTVHVFEVYVDADGFITWVNDNLEMTCSRGGSRANYGRTLLGQRAAIELILRKCPSIHHFIYDHEQRTRQLGSV